MRLRNGGAHFIPSCLNQDFRHSGADISILASFRNGLNYPSRRAVTTGGEQKRAVAMYDETGEPVIALAVGRHTRPQGLAGLRRTCLATLIALVAQFGLGMWLNLYVQVPAADQHAGITQEIKNGPLLLTVHALVGTYLIGAAILLLVKAIRVRSRKVILPACAGLGAIFGAFIAGELFVKNGESTASLWMALLTGISLLCYIYLQALISAARMALTRPRRDDWAEPAPRLPKRPMAANSRRPASGSQPAYPQPGRARPGPGNGFPRQAGPESTWHPWVPRQNSAGSGYPRESLSAESRRLASIVQAC
jgi:hypothetical protein